MPKKRPITREVLEYSLVLAARLKGLREDRGLTQEQVSSLAGLSTKTYQRYEKGMLKRDRPLNPEYLTLAKLAKALTVGLSELLDCSGIEVDQAKVDAIMLDLRKRGVDVLIAGERSEEGSEEGTSDDEADFDTGDDAGEMDACAAGGPPVQSTLITYGPFPEPAPGAETNPATDDDPDTWT